MKFIHHRCECRVQYPVTSAMDLTLELTNKMANILLSIIKSDKTRSHVNIWCRGSSGAVIAALIAQKLINCDLNVRICHVKKDGEDSHSSGVSYYDFNNIINIIVDDFCATGATLNAIYAKMIKARIVPQILCIGQDLSENQLEKLDFTDHLDHIICRSVPKE